MILIALGANLPSHAGPPAATLTAALQMLAQKGVTPIVVSRYYVSEAWPDPLDPPYVNAAARIETSLAPSALMMELEAVEKSFGRVRTARNAPRTLDLDLLDYHGIIRTHSPLLPHPRMVSRGFVLIPLADVAPEWRHPGSGSSAGELIAALPLAQQVLANLD